VGVAVDSSTGAFTASSVADFAGGFVEVTTEVSAEFSTDRMTGGFCGGLSTIFFGGIVVVASACVFEAGGFAAVLEAFVMFEALVPALEVAFADRFAGGFGVVSATVVATAVVMVAAVVVMLVVEAAVVVVERSGVVVVVDYSVD
jgi:hypothetical protein